MDWLVPALFGLGLFAARDCLGLAAFRSRGLQLGYLASLLAIGATLGLVAGQLSQADARAIAKEPSLWGTAIAVHGLLWFLFERSKRSKRSVHWSAWLFVIPSPVLLYAAGGTTWHALRWTNLSGLLAGVSVMALYGALVMVAAFAVRSWSAHGVSPGAAVEFSIAANFSGLLLVLLPHEARPGRVLARHVDWGQSLSVLGIVASMICISFLFARYRASF